jgi:predicted outer membrane repeat protein
MKRMSALALVAIGLATCMDSNRAAAITVYVDLNATGPGSGTMSDPFQTATQAVAAVNTASVGTQNIYIADGTYQSTLNSGLENFGTDGLEFSNPSGGGNFQNVNIYGGYVGLSGGGGADWSTRTSRSTIFDLTGANTRAFDTTTDSRIVLSFDGMTFQNGNATGNGGAIRLEGGFDSKVNVNDSLFQNNTASGNGGALNTSFNSVIQNSEFTSNTADDGGAILAVHSGSSIPLIRNSIFEGNAALGTDGGGAIAASSAVIEQSVFHGNEARNANGVGGAISGLGNANKLTIRQSILTGNSAINGGAIGGSGFQPGTFLVENSLIADNSATNFAIFANGNQNAAVEVRHSTLANNTGGGISTSENGSGDASLVVLDSLLVNNGSVGITTDDPAATIDYNDVLGQALNFAGTAVQGPHGISLDPLFVDASAGDYRLFGGSPAADAGSDIGFVVDLNGDLRPQGSGFAMGAYETTVAVIVPAPEPNSFVLFVMGLLGQSLLLRRRRNVNH